MMSKKEDALSTIVGVAFWVGVVFWWNPCDVRGKVISCFCPNAMFGEKLDFYDHTLWEDGKPGLRTLGRLDYGFARGLHQECIVEFHPHKPSDLFDTYKAHLLPVSHKTFHITASKSCYDRATCEEHFKKVEEMLTLKYGPPVNDTGLSMTFKDGEKEIGLICTDLTGTPMVYVDMFIRSMVEKDLIEEYKQLKSSTLDAL